MKIPRRPIANGLSAPRAKRASQPTHPTRQRQELPPFAALRAFEAVGRLSGIRRAAEALGIDHAGVSRHLRSLEDWAGVRLFSRLEGNRLTLTEEGTRYHARICTALAEIADSTLELVGRKQSSRLRIWCIPGFASRWLMPRLPAFQAAHPDLQLEVHPTDQSPDFSRYEADVDIRYVAGDERISPALVRSGVRKVEIARPAVVAVASPECARRLGRIQRPADLLRAPLLHEEDHQQWRTWFTRQGTEVTGPLRGPLLWHAHLTIEAARCGQGVALANLLIASEDLALGRLVTVGNPVDSDAPLTLGAYVFAARADRWQAGPVALFRNWLKRATAVS